MGGFVGDVFDSVGDVFDDTVDFVKDAANDLVDFAKDTANFITDVTMTVTGTKWLDEQLTGGLLYNTATGMTNTAANMLHGVVDGDWVQFRDAAMGMVTTAVAITAIVAGAVTQQYWLVAAGVVVLDAQYNQGETLGRVIGIAADIEQIAFNTNYIETYAVEIQMIITVAASIYAANGASNYFFSQTQIGAQVQAWTNAHATLVSMVQAGYGGYQIYSAVQQIKNSQEYWAEQLRQAEEYYRKLIAQAQAAKEQWFSMMTDPEMIQRIMPGGDLFSMGAGHELMSVTSVAEPRFMLGLIDTSDPEMDRLNNNRYYAQYAGSEGFKIR